MCVCCFISLYYFQIRISGTGSCSISMARILIASTRTWVRELVREGFESVVIAQHNLLENEIKEKAK